MSIYEQKLSFAEDTKSYDAIKDLLKQIRKDKIRASNVTVKFGQTLLDKYSWRLGDEVWTIYEQVFLAALDTHDDALSGKCLKALQDKFPNSTRVARLEGTQLEQKGEFAKAEAVYNKLLEENPANMLAMKRKVAILKAQDRTQDAIAALNELLKTFQTDAAAWTELGELYLSTGAYRYAAFCFEELVLLTPMDAIFHCRLADIYTTLGGLANLRAARKHYSHSISINKTNNLRAYFGLVVCTKAISAQKIQKSDPEDAELNERVQKFALDYIHGHYTNSASSDLAEITASALSL